MKVRAPPIGVLLVLIIPAALVLLSGYGVFVAFKISGGVHMSVHGYVAMGLAVVLTLVLGGGLMTLAFYSDRHGYDDDQQHQTPVTPVKPPDHRPEDLDPHNPG
jgi:hypothetical protein